MILSLLALALLFSVMVAWSIQWLFPLVAVLLVLLLGWVALVELRRVRGQ